MHTYTNMNAIINSIIIKKTQSKAMPYIPMELSRKVLFLLSSKRSSGLEKVLLLRESYPTTWKTLPPRSTLLIYWELHGSFLLAFLLDRLMLATVEASEGAKPYRVFQVHCSITMLVISMWRLKMLVFRSSYFQNWAERQMNHCLLPRSKEIYSEMLSP